jgi:hypothetical protein
MVLDELTRRGLLDRVELIRAEDVEVKLGRAHVAPVEKEAPHPEQAQESLEALWYHSAEGGPQ